MKTKLSVIIVLLLLLLCIGAAKQEAFGSIKGKVTDGRSKAALANIQVQSFQGNTLYSFVYTDANGAYRMDKLPIGKYYIKVLEPAYKDYSAKVTIRAKKTIILNIKLQKTNRPEAPKPGAMTQNAVIDYQEMRIEKDRIGSAAGTASYAMPNIYLPPPPPPMNTEDYNAITPNIFHSPLDEPLSTFSIDVDTANYSNIRRMLNQGQLPEPNSVRLEELLNYFSYNYPAPKDEHPFAVYSEVGVVPWDQKRSYVHIGLQGRKLALDKAPASNLVFLLDVSGSMDAPNKLPLVVESMKMLVENLRSKDRVAIVVYAGAAGEVLPSTPGSSKMAIVQALDKLRAGGSTAGGAGIQLAYKIAGENLIPDGNNRIILCTDGDFNVGASSDAAMTELVEKNRDKGIYLTLLGFGMGNYKDNRMELLADKGNGNYAYIDTINEAKKVLVNEMVSTLYTIAKDVKLQVEFNPAHVKAYRLVGYENRLLNKEDFKDDKKDAGEMGAGHSVTAIYEIIPMNSKEQIPGVDPLKYQSTVITEEARKSPELMTVHLRYKLPDGDKSIPFDVPVMHNTLPEDKLSENFLFSSAVVGYGMMLQNSEFKGGLTWDRVKELAKANIGKDPDGYRSEFLSLLDIASKLQEKMIHEENRDFNKGE